MSAVEKLCDRDLAGSGLVGLACGSRGADGTVAEWRAVLERQSGRNDRGRRLWKRVHAVESCANFPDQLIGFRASSCLAGAQRPAHSHRMPEIATSAFPHFLEGGGQMGAMMRAHDWSSSSLGPPTEWPASLCSTVSLLLGSRFPMFTAFGAELGFLYNDAYAEILGGKHPAALGARFQDVWREIWSDIVPLVEKALSGEPTWVEDMPLSMNRHGHDELTWFTFSYSPVRNEDGTVAGMFCACTETTGRLRAEERLRESEQQLRLATEAGEIGLWDVDEVNDTLFWQPCVKAMFGISPDVPVSMADYYAGLHPDDREATSAAYAATKDPASPALYDVEYRTIGREDGRVRWVAATGRGLFADGRCVRVIGTARDITARKQAEAASFERDARLQAVFSQAGAGFAMTDLAGGITEANDAYCKIVGRARGELLGLTMQDITHPDDLTRNIPLLQAVRLEGTGFDIEKRYLRPDGEVVWVRNSVTPVRADDGTISAVLIVSVDITDRVHADSALRESEARQRALIEGVPQLVWRAVGVGHWTWASPQWTAFTGQPEPESRGFGWLEPMHPDDRPRALSAWSQAPRTGSLDVEYRLRNAAEDRYRWFQTRAVPVRDANGAILEWFGTSTDIGDLRRLQEQQQVMVAELQHRTRNLIAVVTSIAKETLAQTGPGQAFVAQFQDRLAALSRVQGLLSRSNETPITIEALVRMELDALGVGDLHATLRGPPVSLRPSMVQTLALAIHELATNARKHGALATPGGCLTVNWSKRIEDGSARQRCWLVMDWRETSAQPALQEAERPEHRGYGRELIEDALPFALGARTRFELDADGVRCRIELPLDKRGSTET
ncbi:PAS domain S-box protein [Methylobacterium tardum]|uniref:PAS domain S-box protein n=1 Tax=Methylobacterium tardum TaxID=374432 RepID=UPI0020220BFF|nr:PAS domain S-box protein [Methylobacterium tardum]URD36085.1 PAS domain S-box protein [Methylobacterium tardum]